MDFLDSSGFDCPYELPHFERQGRSDLFGRQLADVGKRIQLQLSQPAVTPFLRSHPTVGITIFMSVG